MFQLFCRGKFGLPLNFAVPYQNIKDPKLYVMINVDQSENREECQGKFVQIVFEFLILVHEFYLDLTLRLINQHTLAIMFNKMYPLHT